MHPHCHHESCQIRSASQAAMNAIPPVGASLEFLLSSVSAVVYKLPQNKISPALVSEPTSRGFLVLGARISNECTKWYLFAVSKVLR